MEPFLRKFPSATTVRTRDIFINTDKGRILAPIARILYDGAPRLDRRTTILKPSAAGEMTFKELVNEGIVEWVDAEEEEDLLHRTTTVRPPRNCTVESGPLAGRPVTQRERFEWANLGEPGAITSLIIEGTKFACQMVKMGSC